MLLRKYSKANVLSNLLICIALIAVTAVVIINKQYIIDQVTVWRFQSTADINGLVERSGVSDYGKFLYLASQQTLDATQSFNNECDRIENTTSSLGCYKDLKIYVYDVTDTQLDGIREVTATHELLHAAYYRLSDDERSKVNALVEGEYAKLEGDSNYADRMAFYARTEPGERDNELHSVIGTEIQDISPELEAYYSKYFTNRKLVVDLNTKYSSVFIDLRKKADDLSAKLNTLAVGINSRMTQYNTDNQNLSNDITLFNERALNGSFTTQAQFNSERATLVSRSVTINATRDSINADIDSYAVILAEYNSIATQSKKLYNSIDSTLAPATSV